MLNHYASYSHFGDLMDYIRPKIHYSQRVRIQQVKITVFEDYVLYHFLTDRCKSKALKVKRDQIPFDISESIGKKFVITDHM